MCIKNEKFCPVIIIRQLSTGFSLPGMVEAEGEGLTGLLCRWLLYCFSPSTPHNVFAAGFFSDNSDLLLIDYVYSCFSCCSLTLLGTVSFNYIFFDVMLFSGSYDCVSFLFPAAGCVTIFILARLSSDKAILLLFHLLWLVEHTCSAV